MKPRSHIFNNLKSMLLASMFLVSLSACYENDSEHKAEQEKLAEKSTAEMESTSSNNLASTDIEKKDSNEKLIIESNEESKDLTAEEPKPQVEISETEKIQLRIENLKSSLNQNTQENATLRQHMDILIKKLEENQRMLNELDSQYSESN